MSLKRITPEEYSRLFGAGAHRFNSVAFNQLNSEKCEELHFLVFCDGKGKERLGIVLGERADMLRSPFSAPFGGFEECGGGRLSFCLEFARELKAYGESCGKPVVITFPPACYDGDSSMFTRQTLCALGGGGSQLHADFNYHYCLEDFDDFSARLWPNARRNLAAALRSGLEFVRFADPTDSEMAEVYNIVRINHESHGYPVHMSLADVMATSKVIDMDFFMVRKDGLGIASAIIYRTSPEVVQLIYWGDLPEGRSCRAMNFLSYNIIRHYSETRAASGLRFFDLGPASSDGVPAVGLCDFKESIGCRLTQKVTVSL